MQPAEARHTDWIWPGVVWIFSPGRGVQISSPRWKFGESSFQHVPLVERVDTVDKVDAVDMETMIHVCQ